MGAMRTVLTTLQDRLRRFPVAEAGVAAVEFALVLPVLLTLYLGSMELSQLLTVDRRVVTIAGTVGDLVARKNGTVTKAEVTDYFKAAEAILAPFPSTGVKQIVTFLSVDAAGVGTVLWSQSYPIGTTKPVAGASYDLSRAPNIRDLAKGKFLVVSQASYAHLPLAGLFFKAAIEMDRENFYLPRYADKITCPDCI